MRNKIIIISIILVFCIAVALIYFLVIAPKNSASDDDANKGDEIALCDRLFDVKSLEDYNKIVSEIDNKSYILDDKTVASVYGFDLYGQNAYITYCFNDAGLIEECESSVVFPEIYSDEKDSEANEDEYEEIEEELLSVEMLQEKSDRLINGFCSRFGISELDNIYVENYDGTFEKLGSKESYQHVFDGNGVIKISIRDELGTYWVFRIYCENGIGSLNIERHYDVEKYIDYYANISKYNLNREEN